MIITIKIAQNTIQLFEKAKKMLEHTLIVG